MSYDPANNLSKREFLLIAIKTSPDLRRSFIANLQKTGIAEAKEDLKTADLTNDEVLVDLVLKYHTAAVHYPGPQPVHFRGDPTPKPKKPTPEDPETTRKKFFEHVKNAPNPEARQQALSEALKTGCLERYFGHSSTKKFFQAMPELAPHGYWEVALFLLSAYPHLHEITASGGRNVVLDRPGCPGFEEFQVFKSHWRRVVESAEAFLVASAKAAVEGEDKTE